jgi:hypothetical protein
MWGRLVARAFWRQKGVETGLDTARTSAYATSSGHM